MKAIITRNDQTAILELPTSRMELAGSLSRIGVRTPAYIIPCSDEEEDYIKVKLFGESDFENELTALVTPKDSLGSVNTALDLYRELPQTQKEKLKAELSQNPPDSLSSLCRKVMDFQPKYVTEDYYFPLMVTVYEYNEYCVIFSCIPLPVMLVITAKASATGTRLRSPSRQSNARRSVRSPAMVAIALALSGS